MAYHLSVVEIRKEINQQDTPPSPNPHTPQMTITQIRHVLASVKDASNEVDTAASEIAKSNDDLSSRTESQASSLEQTAASMNELSVTVKHNMDNAKEANTCTVAKFDFREKPDIATTTCCGFRK